MNRKSFAIRAFSRLAKLVWQLARIALGSGHLAALDSHLDSRYTNRRGKKVIRAQTRSILFASSG